jgi:hypothetical protein
MLSYFKRKFKPRCVGTRSPSCSFERRNSFDNGKIAQNLNDNIKQKSDSKLNTSKSKRKFEFRAKLGLIGSRIKSSKRASPCVNSDSKQVDTFADVDNNESKSNSHVLSESNDSNRFNLASHTNYSYSCSKIDDVAATSKYLNELNNGGSGGEFLNSTSLGQTNSSGYVEYATGSSSSSNYRSSNNTTSQQRTANTSVTSDTSMVTYNTKYANSQMSDDDGLMDSVGSSESMHNHHRDTSSLSMTDNMQQQSTPYNENFARIRSLKVTLQKQSSVALSAPLPKSNTANLLIWKPNVLTGKGVDLSEDLNESYKSKQKQKSKCRRSNTTYTLMGKSSNNKVIDYFNKLELSKPIKKTAQIRKLDKMMTIAEPLIIKNKSEAVILGNQCDKFKKDDAKMTETIDSLNKIASSDLSGDEVEKIQDVLFHDESLMMMTHAAKRANISISSSSNSPSDQFVSDIESLAPSSSASNSASKLPKMLDTKNQSSPQPAAGVDQLETELKLNETHSINCSMEKLRRTISMPGIENVIILLFYFF